MNRKCLWLLLVLNWPVLAAETLFYQPLNADARITAAQWQTIWSDTTRAGFNRVIVQWTRHGQADFGGVDGWLMQSLRQAEAAGLELVLGLYYDPRYYERVKQTQQMHERWREWLLEAENQRNWLLEFSQLSPVGWYIPMELDDKLYQEESLRKILDTDLAVFADRSQRPVHISTFSAGRLTPNLYARWLHALPVDQVWWQDGRGTRALPDDILQTYRAGLSCKVGIIHEVFQQSSAADARFRAVSTTPDLREGCHPAAVFSLRYQPWAAPLLEELHRTQDAGNTPGTEQLRYMDEPD